MCWLASSFTFCIRTQTRLTWSRLWCSSPHLSDWIQNLFIVCSSTDLLLAVHHATESKDPVVLISDSQKDVEAVEWRPNGGSTLSIACRWFLPPTLNTFLKFDSLWYGPQLVSNLWSHNAASVIYIYEAIMWLRNFLWPFVTRSYLSTASTFFWESVIIYRGGIAIWSASYPGNIAPVRAGVVSILGMPNRGTGARWALVDFLRAWGGAPVTTLSWSPCGRYPPSWL